MNLNKLVLAVLLYASAIVIAAEIPMHVYDKDGTVIRLMRGPCSDPRVMEIIVVGMPAHAPRFKAIESTFRMRSGVSKDFAGCWVELTAEEVGFEAFFLLFEDGDKYLVPKAEFLAKRQTDA